MFNDVKETKRMLQGAYRKLKSYYYHNKHFIVMYKKIAEFESDELKMNEAFDSLADALCHPIKSKQFMDALINRIDFYVVPKKFEADTTNNSAIVSNTVTRDKKMKAINFFINAPIELHILDTLWTVFLAKMDYDKKIIPYCVYGNTVNKSALFMDGEINFDNRNLFNVYFNKYSAWRNDAFDTLEAQYNYKKDSLLISLDVNSFFYSVSFSFMSLNQFFDRHYLLKDIRTLTKIMEKMFLTYYSRIASFRKDIEKKKKKHYPLPIGLFSSMFLGNVYLNDFDKSIIHKNEIKYYGRYVDDMLLVFEKTINKGASQSNILDEIFVKNNIFDKKENSYLVKGYDNLKIQTDKIKLLYIDHLESKAIIDLYNDTIRIIPSQMNPIQDANISILNFEESAYTVSNFTKERKIRDIGAFDVDPFKVGKFFSMLPRKYKQIDTNNTKNEVNKHIKEIDKFFSGSQSIEFYNVWLNYMYFLTISHEYKALRSFHKKIKKQIGDLKSTSLDKKVYCKTRTINKRVKEYLLEYLDICLMTSLCLNSGFARKWFSADVARVNTIKHANMFEHSFVTFPLANYLENSDDVSFCKMSIGDLGMLPKKIEESFKFIWSPRFIHYDELLMMIFYYYHRDNFNENSNQYYNANLVNKFQKLNYMKHLPFEMVSLNNLSVDKDHSICTICVPSNINICPSKVFIAIGSLNISLDKCIATCKKPFANITLKEKEIFFDILRETYKCLDKKSQKDTVMFLVLPELCYPIYWISDLIRFAKRSQIGIITGLQYLSDEKKRQYNYIATILPFTTGEKKFKNTFLHIREKNDYSPIEMKKLAELGCFCKDRSIAEYQIFNWKGICIAPMVCFELTDIMARASLKGKCDFIAAPVFNPDTTYFSNIIDSTVRDLHTFIVQANTSFYGDSRITGPYDRDSKDIFKIKGGDNDHVVIGTVDFTAYRKYQNNYYPKLRQEIEQFLKNAKKEKGRTGENEKLKPDIKPFSARYKTEK